jgi:hypothetical protein
MPNGGSDCCGTCSFYSNNNFNISNFIEQKKPWIQRVFSRNNSRSIGISEIIRSIQSKNEHCIGYSQGLNKIQEAFDGNKEINISESKVKELMCYKLSYCTIRDIHITKDPFYTYCANHPHHNAKMNSISIGPIFIGDGWNSRKIWKKSDDSKLIRDNLLVQLDNIINDVEVQYFYPSMSLNFEIIFQLIEFKEKKALNLLKILIEKLFEQNNDYNIRFCEIAIDAYFEISEGESCDFLLNYLSHPKDSIRYAVLRGIIYSNHPSTKKILTDASKDKSTLVRNTAMNCLNSCNNCVFFRNDKSNDSDGFGSCELRQYSIKNSFIHCCYNHQKYLLDNLKIPLGSIFVLEKHTNEKVKLSDSFNAIPLKDRSKIELRKYFFETFVQNILRDLKSENNILVFEEFMYCFVEINDHNVVSNLFDTLLSIENIMLKSSDIAIIENSSILVGQSVEVILKLSGSENLNKLLRFQFYGLEKKGDKFYELERPYILINSSKKKSDVYAPIRYHFVRGLAFVPFKIANEIINYSLNDPHYQIRLFAESIVFKLKTSANSVQAP